MGGFGAFGKMPALGDFFRLNVARSFSEPWDKWLQEGLIEVGAALAERWNDTYLTAPIWRFTLSGGLAGPAGALGVLMPSVDRVGRLFPLTLVAPLGAGACPLRVHFRARTRFEALEEIALAALEDDMTRECLEARLRGLRAVPSAEPAHVTRGPDGALLISAPDGASPQGELAARQAGQGFRVPSVWSHVAARGERMILAEGLPRPAQMRLLFDPDAPGWTDPGHHMAVVT